MTKTDETNNLNINFNKKEQIPANDFLKPMPTFGMRNDHVSAAPVEMTNKKVRLDDTIKIEQMVES